MPILLLVGLVAIAAGYSYWKSNPNWILYISKTNVVYSYVSDSNAGPFAAKYYVTINQINVDGSATVTGQMGTGVGKITVPLANIRDGK